MQKKSILFDSRVDDIIIMLEEATRTTKSNQAELGTRFIEPIPAALASMRSKFHHIVLGRRGSGKTSLLLKSKNDLQNEGTPCIYLNFDYYKESQFPDLALTLMLEIFRETRKQFYLLGFPKRFLMEKMKFVRRIKQRERELKTMLDKVDLSETTFEAGKEISGTAKAGSKGIDMGATAKKNQKESSKFKYSKERDLNKLIRELRQDIEACVELFDSDLYIILDDLYFIDLENQAKIIDFFHRIAKGNNVWLKIGTIRFRSIWYTHQGYKGLKIGDDANDINLDKTLETFSSTKKFQEAVLEKFSIADITALSLMNAGARERLAIASGGVLRDYINIFRRAIIQARNRLNQKAKGILVVGTEDINFAANQYGENKKQELQTDTSKEEASELENIFMELRNFCVQQTNRNCFLVDYRDRDTVRIIQELEDLRLVHLVKSKETISKLQGESFYVYLLDLSEYSARRAIQGFEIIEFWKDASRDKLRNMGMVFSLSKKDKEQHA